MHVRKITKLKPKDSVFPERLKQIPAAPKQLFILGNPQALNQTMSLAIIGSRKVSAYGRWATQTLTEEIITHGVTIVSGLAYGVDAAAHKAALEGQGITVAVLAGGLDRIYPALHTGLAQQIVRQGGAIVSEYEPGTPPLRQNFVARNRLVAGLSDGVLIVEASVKSGALHTANFALEQGKSVMAVPGNINSPESSGTNQLIKSGAASICGVKDVLEELGIDTTVKQSKIMGDTPEQTILIELMKSGITDSGLLLNKSGLDARTFNQTLTMLEISGKILSLGANHWRLR